MHHNAHQQNLARFQVVVVRPVPEGQRLHEGVQAEPGHHPQRHPAVQRMRVAVFDPHRNRVQRHLHEEAGEHQSPNQQRAMLVPARRCSVWMIQLR